MDSINLNTIDQRLCESMGDWLRTATTTNISGTGKDVISTNLNAYDSARDDYFNTWWLFVEDGTNADIERKVQDYTTATGDLLVFGSVLSSATGSANFRLTRYSRTDRDNAINETLREIYPVVHKRIDNQILITGNHLPNAHFEDQATAGTPDNYAFTNASGAAETTIIRGGAKSVKVTASAANGYMKVTQANWPRLLDLSGHTVDFYCWVYAEAASDAFLTIYTADKDGNTQTLNSTTTMDATTWTMIKLENQDLNDDLVTIEFRFRVLTNAKYVIFDNARVISQNVYEHLLPTEIQDGDIQKLFIQTSGTYEGASTQGLEMCDSIKGQTWEQIHDWNIINDGANKYLRLERAYLKERQLRIIGTAPFSALSAQTDAIVIEQEKVPLITAYARYKLFKGMEDIPSAEDISRFERATAKAYADYLTLSNRLRMGIPSKAMKLPSW